MLADLYSVVIAVLLEPYSPVSEQNSERRPDCPVTVHSAMN